MATRTALPRPEARTLDEVPSILAIVVTHNGRQWLKDCLVSLGAQTYPLLDVLVVDDASLDPKREPRLKRVAKRHLKRRRWGYVRTPRPLGFGGAINWALSRVKTDADLLLFIHDDAALDPRAIERMTGRLLVDDVTAIVGPKIVAWDDPNRLEEVGMAADRFGYPYKGLEEGELDLGQHDASSEVFYVTSTCMLVRHDVFRDLRGWDARLRAFAEDLDLCWRARLGGFLVRTEPQAKARHAIALATGQRRSPFSPARYFIRRNRLRTVFKNVSTLRLLLLVPQFVLLTFAEMIGFVILRQPGQIVSLLRALGWNVLRLPQTLAERAGIQRRRKVPDRTLRRLTVRESTRIRAYVGNQTERLEEIWGRRADLVARRSSQVRIFGGELKGWLGAAAALVVIALLLGFRHVLWAPSASVGELLPYPESATAVLRAFLAPWREVGLGEPGPAPPALALLGWLPVLTLGGAGAAQKLLVLCLGIGGFIGAYRLVSDLVDRWGRFAAGAAYMLGAVGFAGLREGALGAMVFGAVAPYVLLVLVRLTGWVRPPKWDRGRAVARLALGGAISAAFVPGALFIYLIAGILLAAGRLALGSGRQVLRSLGALVVGLLVSWVLLLPWSATWLEEGAPLRRLWGDETWRSYASAYRGHGMLSMVAGQTPEAPVLFGLALPLLGIVAVLVGNGQRKRLALAMWGLIAALGLLVTLVAAGSLRPPVASPTEAGVLAAAAFAALVGLAVGAFRMDLPRRDFGYAHWVSLAGLSLSLFLVCAGLGPALWNGDWKPGGSADAASPQVVAQIGALLEAEAQETGPLRALWVGDLWSSGAASAARPFDEPFLTGASGHVLTDLFESQEGEAADQLERVVRSVERGTTDEGGSLLGMFNVRYVVVSAGEGSRPWLEQRDLALVREEPPQEPQYLLLENEAALARAGVYEEVPSLLEAVETGEPAPGSPERLPPAATARRLGPGRYRAEDVPTTGTVVVAESEDQGWRARAEGAELARSDGGWANAFELSSEGPVTVDVSYPRSLGQVLWVIFFFVAWIMVLGGSFSRRRRSGRVEPRARKPARVPRTRGRP